MNKPSTVEPYRIQITLNHNGSVFLGWDAEGNRINGRNGDVFKVPEEVDDAGARLVIGGTNAKRLEEGEKPEPIGSQAKKRGRPKKEAAPDAD